MINNRLFKIWKRICESNSSFNDFPQEIQEAIKIINENGGIHCASCHADIVNYKPGYEGKRGKPDDWEPSYGPEIETSLNSENVNEDVVYETVEEFLDELKNDFYFYDKFHFNKLDQYSSEKEIVKKIFSEIETPDKIFGDDFGIYLAENHDITEMVGFDYYDDEEYQKPKREKGYYDMEKIYGEYLLIPFVEKDWNEEYKNACIKFLSWLPISDLIKWKNL